MKLFIGNPTYPSGPGSVMSVRAQMRVYARHPDWLIHRMEYAMSILTANFNTLWAQALTLRDAGQITHFLMLHHDVSPRGDDWFDVLLGEMEAHAADVLSAIVPIKDYRGLTSTAFDTHPWRPRRLTLREALARPATWTAPDLLFNTGVLLVDFRKPWVEEICAGPFGAPFSMRDRIARDATGRWQAYVQSEDWVFSRQCRALGVRAFVTRAVPIDHFGVGCWASDDPPPGAWDADEQNAPHAASELLAGREADP